MRYAQPGCRAFSLIEILVTLVITAVIGLGVYNGVMSSSDAGIRSKDRAEAMRLLQDGIETIKYRIVNSPTLFDDINALIDADWVDIPDEAYPAGFFKSKVTLSFSSVDLKQLLVAVKWRDRNDAELVISQKIDLGRPPQKFFGNIKGYVRRKDTGSVIQGAAVILIQGAPQSLTANTNNSGLYTFLGSDQQRRLPVGDNYMIKVTAPGYHPYQTPAGELIKVFEGVDTEVDVELEWIERSATVSGQVINSVTNELISGYNIYVSLSRGGSSAASVSATSGEFSLKIDLPLGEEEACYTLATGVAGYGNGYFPFYSTGGVWCGYMGGQYRVEGWSSSGQWFGGENICLQPGSVIDQNVYLVMAPSASVTVEVKDEEGHLVEGASVWGNDSYGSGSWSGTTGSDGTTSFTVPALGASQISLTASKDYTGTLKDCCGAVIPLVKTGSTTVSTPDAGGSVTAYITISGAEGSSAPTCGGVSGTITDVVSGAALSSVTVSVGNSATTDGSGNYELRCSSCASGPCTYPLRTGAYNFQAQRWGYYTKSSGYSDRYAGVSGVDVSTEGVTVRNDTLYPIGRGSLQVTVLAGSSSNPGATLNTTVSYSSYDGSDSRSTGGSSAYFNNVAESWPPTGVNTAAYGLSSSTSNVYVYASTPAGYVDKGEGSTSVVVTAGVTTNVTLYLYSEKPPAL